MNKETIEAADNLRKLSTFLSHDSIAFGDYLLFQEYIQGHYDGNQYHYKVSKPILVIYLGYFVCDQTLGFNYIKWVNQNHSYKVTNKYGTHTNFKEVENVNNHIEWDDYIDILGHWDKKPKWKEIIASYRKRNTEQNIGADEINWF